MTEQRLIDANEVICGMEEIMKSPWYNDDKMTRPVKKETLGIVKDLCVGKAKTVDAVPVVHGRWIDNTKLIEGYPDYRFNCSECDFTVWRARLDRSRYCPNCGAKMDAKEET